jgi:flagellin
MYYLVSNLSTTEENLTAAESRIRDVDMAEEMVSYTKDNILNQSAMAMLAQANQQPQAILSLLQ